MQLGHDCLGGVFPGRFRKSLNHCCSERFLASPKRPKLMLMLASLSLTFAVFLLFSSRPWQPANKLQHNLGQSAAFFELISTQAPSKRTRIDISNIMSLDKAPSVNSGNCIGKPVRPAERPPTGEAFGGNVPAGLGPRC